MTKRNGIAAVMTVVFGFSSVASAAFSDSVEQCVSTGLMGYNDYQKVIRVFCPDALAERMGEDMSREPNAVRRDTGRGEYQLRMNTPEFSAVCFYSTEGVDGFSMCDLSFSHAALKTILLKNFGR